MKMTHEEDILLKRLKKQVSDTRKFRWYFIVMGFLLLLLSFGAHFFFLASGNFEAAERLINNPM